MYTPKKEKPSSTTTKVPRVKARSGRARGSQTAVSLRQIAAETGLAVATVSRILRGTDECLPATRQRVIAVAQRLGYRPNLLVQALKTGRSNTIGAMVYVGNEFDACILKGIHEALMEADCLPLLAWVTPGTDVLDRGNEREQIHRLLDRRVDGIILYPREDTVEDVYLGEVWDRGIPLVTVDHELPKTHADFVGTDDAAGGRLAAEHLLALGHRLLGHLAGPAELTPGIRRRQGFESAIAACPDAVCVTIEDVSFGTDSEVCVHQLLAHEPRPTAIFTANDTQARILYRVAAERGLTIPRDLSVVGFADLSFAQDLNPPLTTLRQNPGLIGQRAAQFVLDRRDGRWNDPTPRKEQLMPELIVRSSTAPNVAAGGPPAAKGHNPACNERAQRQKTQVEPTRATPNVAAGGPPAAPAPLSYDGPPETRAFWGGSLPHWDVLGRPIFLTIHVDGAIPAQAASRIRLEAARLTDRAQSNYTVRLKHVFKNMETWLDRNDHPPVLTHPEISALLREAIAAREARGGWRVLHWVLMPSHLHLLYVGGTESMKAVVTDFKRWTGRHANAILGRAGSSFWQREWFDHWSRSANETDRIAAYIRHNPVEAGLVKNAEDWPHGSWSHPVAQSKYCSKQPTPNVAAGGPPAAKGHNPTSNEPTQRTKTQVGPTSATTIVAAGGPPAAKGLNPTRNEPTQRTKTQVEPTSATPIVAAGGPPAAKGHNPACHKPTQRTKTQVEPTCATKFAVPADSAGCK